MALRIGLVGLGVMGVPMAQNISRAGLPLTVYNRSAGPRRQFENSIVTVAGSVAEVFAQSDAIILMLNDGEATDAVLGRTNDIFEINLADRIVVNTATMTPAYSKGLGEAIAKSGGVYVEAPVSGSKAPAEAGELLIMAAGDEEIVKKIQPVFDAIGKETVFCGAIPGAMAMKSASNLQLAGIMSGLAESVNFARGFGLDLELYSKVILNGPLANDFLRMKLPRAIAEDYAPQAAVKNVAYSLDVMIEAAHSVGAETPSAKTMRKTCEKALQAGDADKDIMTITKALKQTENR
ncbi:NAD(P)-dependent oxidoreductase [Hyphococcus sp.]|uniref:NAD(P)-dependent oxidoreductase n=1 Tax=Hyphococcus sp. TaxID=2038636 RepID=UPI003CCC1E6C